MKHFKLIASAGAVAAALLLPGIASASFVLDSGTPTSNSAQPDALLSSAQWIAAEFAVTSPGVQITQLAAYLTQGVGTIGDTFTYDIYSATGFTGRSNQRELVYSTTGTFSNNGGWNSVAANWTPTVAGDYWVALQVSSTTQTKGLDAPGAGITTASATSPSGTAPALAFAFTGTNGQYNVESTSAPTTPFGIEVTESPVPIPAALPLLLSGLIGCALMVRRKDMVATGG
jgi:hypothetical protein